MLFPTSFKKKKALVVDDTNSIRMLTRSILMDAGFKFVAQAKNGNEAYNIIKNTRIDFVICDWNMPVMNGLELFKLLQGDPELKKVAFIMLTSSSEKEKVKEALASGVTHYILKPFNADTLLKNISEILQEIENSSSKKA